MPLLTVKVENDVRNRGLIREGYKCNKGLTTQESNTRCTDMHFNHWAAKNLSKTSCKLRSWLFLYLQTKRSI